MPRSSHLFVQIAVISGVLGGLAVPARAERLHVRAMELAGEAIVTASPWDIGSKDNLFDWNWDNIYRTDANNNPAVITVEFTQQRFNIAAVRGKFSHTEGYLWTFEAADSVAELNSQSGTYVRIFGPLQVPGDGSIQWEQWHDGPVARYAFRFTVLRQFGDNHVHIHELELQTHEEAEVVEINGQDVTINTIDVSPTECELPVGSSVQFEAEASFYYGPQRYDVTQIVTWTAELPAVASVTADGLATGLSAGETAINADVGIVHGEAWLAVRDIRPVDLNVGFIHRTPEYNRFMVSFDGDQHIAPGYENEKKWPDAGETVTYTAHVFNKGDLDAGSFAYRWYFDDELVEEGTIAALPAQGETTLAYSAPWPADTVQVVDVPPGAMTLLPRQLERAIGDHRIRLELDPDDQIAEACELNNVVEDYINALTFWFFMDDTSHELFNRHASFLESYSAEDWVRGQLIGLERRLRVSGCPQKLRVDMLAIYPDGGLDPGGTHGPIGDPVRQADGIWGFEHGGWQEENIEMYAKIVQNPLAHELGHQIGLIDVYQYDVATQNCLITRNGNPVAGTALMPLVSPWNVYYGNLRLLYMNGTALVDGTRRALMADPAARFVGPGSAAGMNRNLGLRRGFFGDYLGAIQQGEIKLRVQTASGAPLANYGIRVFQRELSSIVPDNPKFTGVTDVDGEWIFPDVTEPGWNGGVVVNNPWSWKSGTTVYKAPDAVGRNVPLVVELTSGSSVEYHWVEVDELNVAMGAGQLDDYTIVLTTYLSRRGNSLPAISFNGAPESVFLDEGEVFEATISATDVNGDPVTLSATPLWNSTFDPATGHFTFQPDSLQVNRFGPLNETMTVTFSAHDGKFASTKTMYFSVFDIPGFAWVNEPAPEVRKYGDLNCDGAFDGGDIDPFFQALIDPVGYGDLYPDCDYTLADMNRDGHVDGADIDAFFTCLGQGCP